MIITCWAKIYSTHCTNWRWTSIRVRCETFDRNDSQNKPISTLFAPIRFRLKRREWWSKHSKSIPNSLNYFSIWHSCPLLDSVSVLCTSGRYAWLVGELWTDIAFQCSRSWHDAARMSRAGQVNMDCCCLGKTIWKIEHRQQDYRARYPKNMARISSAESISLEAR